MHNPAAVGTRTLLAKSCGSCHNLKQADEYPLFQTGKYDTYCKDCRRVINLEANKRKNDNSQKGALRSGERWTENDLYFLALFTSWGLSQGFIAHCMCRSVLSVNSAQNRYIRSREVS